MPKRKGQPAPQPWSEQEVERLIQLIGQGVPEHYLCDLLGRTAAEMGQKMKELAISLPSHNHPATPPEALNRRSRI
jgi:hypothetical protein